MCAEMRTKRFCIKKHALCLCVAAQSDDFHSILNLWPTGFLNADLVGFLMYREVESGKSGIVDIDLDVQLWAIY